MVQSTITLTFIIIWLVFAADIKRSDWPIVGHYCPVIPTGRKTKAKKPYNKKIINLERWVFTGKSQTLALPY